MRYGIKLSIDDFWALLECSRGNVPEEIARPIAGVDVTGERESYHNEYFTLQLKLQHGVLASLDAKDQKITEYFTLGELWNLAHILPQTACQNARAILMELFKGIGELTSIPLESEPEFGSEITSVESFLHSERAPLKPLTRKRRKKTTKAKAKGGETSA